MSDRTRRERVSFSDNRTKLDFQFKDPDFRKKWYPYVFTDEGDRIARAIAAEYQFVEQGELVGAGNSTGSENTDLSSKVSLVVKGRSEGVAEARGILMKLPMDLHLDDMASKSRRNALSDDAIKAGNAGGANVENKYGDIQVS